MEGSKAAASCQSIAKCLLESKPRAGAMEKSCDEGSGQQPQQTSINTSASDTMETADEVGFEIDESHEGVGMVGNPSDEGTGQQPQQTAISIDASASDTMMDEEITAQIPSPAMPTDKSGSHTWRGGPCGTSLVEWPRFRNKVARPEPTTIWGKATTWQ